MKAPLLPNIQEIQATHLARFEIGGCYHRQNGWVSKEDQKFLNQGNGCSSVCLENCTRFVLGRGGYLSAHWTQPSALNTALAIVSVQFYGPGRAEPSRAYPKTRCRAYTFQVLSLSSKSSSSVGWCSITSSRLLCFSSVRNGPTSMCKSAITGSCFFFNHFADVVVDTTDEVRGVRHTTKIANYVTSRFSPILSPAICVGSNDESDGFDAWSVVLKRDAGSSISGDAPRRALNSVFWSLRRWCVCARQFLCRGCPSL